MSRSRYGFSFVWLLTSLLLLTPNAIQAAEGNLELLAKSRRIMFLGDSITASGKYVAYFDAWIATRRLDAPPVVIDAGLSSETVSGLSEEGHAGGKFPRPDLFERIDRLLPLVKPDLVFACYGINCGIYQLFDEARFAAYQKRYAELKAKVEAAGAQFVVITPPFYDELRKPSQGFSYNGVLDRYAAWLVNQRDQGWRVIDLHTAMTREVTARRQSEPMFTFQPDGVHPNDAGHWFMAQQLIAWCGDESSAAAATPQTMLAQHKVPAEALDLVQKRVFVLRDAYVGAAGHKRPGVAAGLPIDEATAKYESLSRELLARLPAKP